MEGLAEALLIGPRRSVKGRVQLGPHPRAYGSGPLTPPWEIFALHLYISTSYIHKYNSFSLSTTCQHPLFNLVQEFLVTNLFYCQARAWKIQSLRKYHHNVEQNPFAKERSGPT